MECKLLQQNALCILLACLCSYSTISATVIATSNCPGTTLYTTFASPVHNKVYDRTTGTIYLALNVETPSKDMNIEDILLKDDTIKVSEPTECYLAKALRPIGCQKPQFTNIPNISTNIDLLALASEPCDNSPYLAFVEFTGSGTSEKQRVNIIENDGSNKHSSDPLKDALGNETCDIVAIAANKSFIFAAVTPGVIDCSSPEALFGEKNSGIAVVGINPITLELKQTAAQGGTEVKARTLDFETDQVKIASDVTFTNNTADLFWDHQLQRLYIGLQLATGSASGDGAKAVVVGQVSTSGVLTLYNIAPDSAFAPGTNNIVGTKTIGGEAYVSIKHIRIMHCSTGPSYLIVNGGVGLFPNQYIYALPLIETTPLDPLNGTLADKNSMIVNYKFVTPAITNAQLPAPTDSAAQVGAGALPIQPDTEISDMVVLGDTVYVSINTNPDESNDSGVFYSQALFDETGKIVRWTPWTKRALPFNAFPNTANSQGQIAFFDVDAVTGKLWAVEGTELKAVASTAWDRGTSCNSLPTQLNNIFNKNACNKGSFSVLDLDQSTRGFTDDDMTTTYRYALFGGTDKVVFAHISTAYTTTLVSPQIVIEDFSLPENLLVTNLPPCSGPVNVLEYSRTPTTLIDNLGYFFAGTNQGLFVFADNEKKGFNISEFGDLNQPPFSTGTWYHINLSGSVVDIKTLGNRLYVIMVESSCQQPFKSQLYGINFVNNLDDMFSPTNINLLAESGVGVLSKVLLFTGLEVVATGTDADPLQKEQIILATSNGLYRSCADQVDPQDGMISTTDQAGSNWKLIPSKKAAPYSTKTLPYWGITAPDAPIPSTVWPISIDDKSGCNTFQYSSVQQLSITSTTCCSSLDDTCTFVPYNFNALSDAPVFQMLDPITYFWSDGARRFFVIQRPRDPYCLSRLLLLPYNNFEWCIINPESSIIFDPIVLNTKRFYWISHIGASGILMVGTDSGVIALE